MAIYYEMKIICEKVGLTPKTLRVWMEEGLISPRREGRRYLFDEEDLKRLLLIRRLRDDLGVNLAGIDIILQLLDRVQELEKEIERLKGALGEGCPPRLIS
ncbi:regulatory protein MerR [Thermodesulfatator indicus DSM 15286]|uniref:Regulatory protein MerR n=1 Tax=Thermodesulfatator indicus (strain DSM 15286 / JCM 11887 / CIR29812) TaxID=667014 RepID=F8A901_THEID|nr:chaperone modulator CbpM [Thermodesulfatator indicus]AEH44050.1 regulatory protein MerR [Thermodesulfatator indicus DSM 15286]